MSRNDLPLWVFRLIDDEIRALHVPRLRSRGPQATTPADAGVATVESVGEFRGVDTDEGVYRHFVEYHAAESPALPTAHRTAFARRAANLRAVKQALRPRWAGRLPAGPCVWPAASCPLAAGRFARATLCERFAGDADYGYDHCPKRTAYGLRVHLRADRAGVIQACQIAPARASDKAVLPGLAGPPGATGIGDRGSYPPPPAAALAGRGVRFLTPCTHKSKDPDRAARRSRIRYRLETVSGQPADRHRAKRAWARDLWHLTHRVPRTGLGHTATVCLARRHGHHSLSLDALRMAA